MSRLIFGLICNEKLRTRMELSATMLEITCHGSYLDCFVMKSFELEWGQSMSGPIANTCTPLFLHTTLYDLLFVLTFVSKVITANRNFCLHLHIIDNQCPNMNLYLKIYFKFFF